MSGILSDFAAVFTRWRVWFLMAGQDIALRYRRSLLGPFWISLSLGALVLGMALLFGQIFQMDLAVYLTWLGVSLLIWTYLAALLNEGCGAAIDAETQLRSVSIPLPVLAARVVHRNLIVFAHNLLVIVVLLVVFGYRPTMELVWAPLGLAVLTLTGFFAVMVLAPICLRFRDFPQIVANVLQIVFFLTPIIWLPTQGRVPSWVIEINPFHHFMELVRAPILGAAPSQLSWIVTLSILGGLIVLAAASLGVSRRKLFVWL